VTPRSGEDDVATVREALEYVRDPSPGGPALNRIEAELLRLREALRSIDQLSHQWPRAEDEVAAIRGIARTALATPREPTE
jgi:hypothetical protein